MENLNYCNRKAQLFALTLLFSGGIKYPVLFLPQGFGSFPQNPNSIIDFQIHGGYIIFLVFLWKLLFVAVWLLEIYPLLRVVMVVDLTLNGRNLCYWTSSYIGGSVVLLSIDFLLQPERNFFAVRMGIQCLTAVGLVAIVLISNNRKHRVFATEIMESAV